MATVDQQIINTQLRGKIDIVDAKFNQFMEEMRDFKREVRENTAEMRSIGKHVQNLTIAAMVGIGALALSGGAIAVAVIYSVFNSIPK